MTIKGVCELAEDFTSVITINDAYAFALENCTKWFGLYDLEAELMELVEDRQNYSGDELAADIRKETTNGTTVYQ